MLKPNSEHSPPSSEHLESKIKNARNTQLPDRLTIKWKQTAMNTNQPVKIIGQEITPAQRQKSQLDIDLQKLEEQYQMSSSKFHQKFHTGELGDDIDFVEWNAFYQMSNSLQKQIDRLQSETN